MIRNFNPTDRRILTSPAVHPCEGISPTTLFNSLLTLSQNICNFNSIFFPSQKRNAREVIRQIGILLIFLEDIRDRRLILPDSVVLCFSELHLTFQKIHFLLEDCTREGAKLWILMKSQLISTRFRVLVRGISTALDILPLNLIDVGFEVKELVELVTRQARKAKFDLDPEDEWVSEQVVWILNYFEKGIEPDLSFIKCILDYLEIRGWTDCAREINFLEEEIGFQSADSDEREVPFLSSLLGLMSYCRGVIFESFDHRSFEQIDGRCNMEIQILSCLNPEDFRCPISLELMTDPVTISTGQTYDRPSIEKWLKAGNIICPKTGEKLRNTELVPNSSLLKLIQRFCADYGVSLSKSGSRTRDITRTILPGSPAAAETIKVLSRFLAKRLVFGSIEQRKTAAQEIRILTKSNIYNRSCLIESGTIQPLVKLLSLPDRIAQENAIGALLKLSKHSNGKKIIMDIGGLKQILSVLKSGLSYEAKQIAAATIFYLASVKENRKLLGENPETIPGLVELIKEKPTCGKKNAVAAIFALLLYPGNHKKVVESGVIPSLIEIIGSSDKDELVADSLAVIAAVGDSVEGTSEILKSKGLSMTIRSLKSLGSKVGKEYCVSILLCLSKNGGEEVMEELSKDSGVTSSLYSLITDGTSHASNKARSLLKILHKFRETSTSSRFIGSGACEHLFHMQ
ncbi:U-box domain-containing protein 19-like [Euphorbia lathyris]|uniref:U-box domain-containing protein 19-like n=1 Tax=Euphorbia lathyris TaxID=212925 RepID=UPI0033141C57